MDPVTLLQCQRYKLMWVQERGELICPRCRKYSTVPSGPVIVAGFEVKVKAVTLHGAELALAGKRVQKNLDTLYLYERCEHGYLTWRICPTCYKKLAS